MSNRCATIGPFGDLPFYAIGSSDTSTEKRRNDASRDAESRFADWDSDQFATGHIAIYDNGDFIARPSRWCGIFPSDVRSNAKNPLQSWYAVLNPSSETERKTWKQSHHTWNFDIMPALGLAGSSSPLFLTNELEAALRSRPVFDNIATTARIILSTFVESDVLPARISTTIDDSILFEFGGGDEIGVVDLYSDGEIVVLIDKNGRKTITELQAYDFLEATKLIQHAGIGSSMLRKGNSTVFAFTESAGGWDFR